MVQLQILNKCLAEGNLDLIDNNELTAEHFTEYKDEYTFIKEHYEQYGVMPDKATVASKFTDFEFLDVAESDRYLIDTIREEYLFAKSVPIIQRAAELLNTDANAYIEYMKTAMADLEPNYGDVGIDIIANAKKRFNEFSERKRHPETWFFSSGFPELDTLMHGIQRVDEFILIYARTNKGKSWVLEVMCNAVWETGNNVGYFSPEMSDSSIGYRFDTLHQHFSNTALTWGKDDISDREYEDYINELSKSSAKFIVSTPKDFKNNVTVSKLRSWVKKYDLKALFIDGLSYLEDERMKKGDTDAKRLTHLGEDLMSLSMELHIPVIGVAQANRSGVTDKDSNDTPEIESVHGGDGLSFNASKVIAIHQNKDGNLILEVKKQRNGLVGKKVCYEWNADAGTFLYIPIDEDVRVSSAPSRPTQQRRANTANKSMEDVF